MGEKREKSKILKTNFAARIRDVSWLHGSRRKEELAGSEDRELEPGYLGNKS